MTKEFLLISCRNIIAKVPIDQIYFIERNGRKLNVVTCNDEYSYYEKICNVEGLLNSDFFMCRQGFIINMSKVIKMEKGCITFDNEKTYWLGRDNFVRTKKVFKNYLFSIWVTSLRYI